MDRRTRQLVQRRANDACEYCRMPQGATPFIPFHIEHITAKQHGGTDEPNWLALACDRCNAYKGPNLTSIDDQTGDVVLLFSPRHDVWDEHFILQDGRIMGVTAIGRATVRLLQMNAPRRVELRKLWVG